MIWTIIGLLILTAIGSLVKMHMLRTAVDTTNYIKTKHDIKKINTDFSRLEKEWHIRVKQLNIPLDKAICPKYYTHYYENKNKEAYSYLYLWPEEGAIAGFPSLNEFDNNGKRVKFRQSPLQWNIHYMELIDIRGIYRRNDVCLIQFDDTSLGFPVSEYAKIKAVYERAKAMTE